MVRGHRRGSRSDGRTSHRQILLGCDGWRNRKGNASTYAYGVSDTYKQFQDVIITLGGIPRSTSWNFATTMNMPHTARAISPRFARRTVSMNARLSMNRRVTLLL